MTNRCLKPEERVRLKVVGNLRKLIVYNAPIVEVDKEDRILERLPDPLSDGWNKAKAVENIMKFPDEKIGIILLNQLVIAGIGNILRNEILFRAGVSPERKVKDHFLYTTSSADSAEFVRIP